MNAESPVLNAAGGPVPHVRLLQAIIAAFIALKLVYIFTAGPIADEAYYWMWGQHPGLSYYDHPPFQAWMLGLVDLMLGRSLFALRILTLATLAGTFYVYHLWAKRFARADWQRYFWPGLVIYLASPTFGFFTSMAMHDYMLVFLCLLSGHFFLNFLTDYPDAGKSKLRDLYLGALFLGLTGLTKYTGVLFGLGLFAYLVMTPRLRPLFRNPHLYAAALIAIGLQLPILIFNWQTGFASFQFHLSGRHPEGWLSRINVDAIVEFVVVSVLMIGPFLVPAFIKFLMANPETRFEQTAKGLAIPVFWISSLLFLGISFFDRVWWWWNLLAYVLLLPFAAKYMGQRILFYGHVILGTALHIFLLISSSVVPLLMVWGMADPVRSQLYGWDQLQAPIAQARETYRPNFIATMSSEVAGVVGFAIDDPDVTALTPILNQFDYWFDPKAHDGQSAIVVIKDNSGLDFVTTQFATMTEIGVIPVERFGVKLGTFRLYHATGFLAPVNP